MRPWVRLLVAAILASVSSVSAAPIGDTAKVTVTRELVSLYGVPLMARAALTQQRIGWKIEPLMEALTDRRSHLSEGPSTQAGDLRCVLDVSPSVEFLIVKRVLYTCIDAGYRSIEFVGRGKPLSRWFTNHDGHIEIALIVTEHGFKLLASPGTPIVVSDAKSLAEQLAALRRSYPRESHLLIRVEDSVMYAKVREADQLVTAAGFSEVLFISTLPEETKDGGTGSKTDRAQSQQMRTSIQATIRTHGSEVRTCYEAGLSRNPQIQGKVLVYFYVDPTGFVVHANVQSSTLRDQEVEICLITAVRRWKFDKTEEGVVVTYPFVLRAD